MDTQISIRPMAEFFKSPIELPSDDFAIFESLVDSTLAPVFDPQSLKIYKQRLETEVPLRMDVVTSCEMLAIMLEESENADSFLNKLNEYVYQTTTLLEENSVAYKAQTEAERTTLLSLHEAYAEGNGNFSLFVYQRDNLNKYMNQLEFLLDQEFGRWRMKNSPSHIAFTEAITDSVTLKHLQKIGKKTLAMIFNAIPPFQSMKNILEYIENNPIISSNQEAAFLVTLATYGVKSGGDEEILISLHPKMMAKIVANQVGINISSLDGLGLAVNAVNAVYDIEDIDADQLQGNGIIQVTNDGKLMSACTANQSSVTAYGAYTSMEIFIMMQRSMISMAKRMKFADWDSEKEEAFEEQLSIYFNSLYDLSLGRRILAKPIDLEHLKINYNEDSQKVTVSFEVVYKGIAKGFSFLIKSKKGKLTKVKAKVA